MPVSLTVTGIDEAKQWMKAYSSAQDKATRSAIRKGALVIANAEKAALGPPARLARGQRKELEARNRHVPGTLYRSIRPNRPRSLGSGRWEIAVGPSRKTARYRSVQERRKRYVAKGVAAGLPLVRAVIERAWREARA
jgi:hypothetical protein